MSVDKDEIVEIRSNRFDGIDKSIYDYSGAFTVPIAVTKVTKPLNRERGVWYIGLKQTVEKGDIIQVGNYGIKYRIIKFAKMEESGRLFRVKRTDNFNITALDVSGINIGDKVKILTRQGIKDGMFNKP